MLVVKHHGKYFLIGYCQEPFVLNPLVSNKIATFLYFIEVSLYESITPFSGNLNC